MEEVEEEKIGTQPRSRPLSPLQQRSPSHSPTPPTPHTQLPLSTTPPPPSITRTARAEGMHKTREDTTTTTPTTTMQRRRGDGPFQGIFILTSESHTCNC